jgi:hypothetical protein
MSGNNYQYDNPLRETYRWLAEPCNSGVSLIDGFVGPAGMKGRVVNIATVRVAGFASDTTLDVKDGNNDLAVSHTITAGAGGGYNAIPRADLANIPELAADTGVAFWSNGESASGTANITLTIDWYN